ncbi:MAG: hypothetical protein EU539_11680 [Promethearchaeota archaeon]|nr:MAG: hypothetical protein EU539_11680 [Candidatus Lokiarchaeota archaeon]
MLYTIFLYQSKSGLLIYDKNFQNISDGKMELFASFFSALKSFIGEMVLEGSKELKNIELGDYTVLITPISEINADLVLIGDKDDHKQINKMIPKLVKTILKHQEIFLNWKGNRVDFEILDQPISELISSNKKLIGEKSLIEKPDVVLKSIWGHRKDLTPQEIENLKLEMNILENKIEDSPSLPNKLIILEKLVEISEKIKDDQNFIRYQQKIKETKDEIRDTTIKLNYYLEKIKKTINQAVANLRNKPIQEGDYKDVYLNLFSFSNKLKYMTDDDKWKQYRKYADVIINREEVSREELSSVISEILKMKENIEDYLN